MMKRRFALLALAILPPGPAQAQEPSQQAKDREQIMSVQVNARDAKGRDMIAYGTGFLIHPAGYALTADHIFEEIISGGAIPATIKVEVQIADLTGPKISASFERGAHDIALLKLDYRASGYASSQLLCNNGFELSNLPTRAAGFPYICRNYNPTTKSCNSGGPHYIPYEGKTSQAGDAQASDTMEVRIRFDYGPAGRPSPLRTVS